MPGSVPKLLFSCPDEGCFGMEYLGDGFANWKDLLLAGEFHTCHAELAGNLLGEIHRRTGLSSELQKKFDTTANFHQLRVDPYLLTTGARHPDLRNLFNDEALRIESTREALVHGDFSPKNILIRGDRMVLLDCEVAWYGDPVFDVAFLLNHLLLKALHHAPPGAALQNMAAAFWRAYLQARSSMDVPQFEKRLVPLLQMLLLARVDGKSPVEYLTTQKQQIIRKFVREHLPSPPESLAELCGAWFATIQRTDLRETNP
jgi:aminoglycoside phosphotransferase (APT) family kinase protein